MEISVNIKKLIELAILEDVGQGDVTSDSIIPEDASGVYVFAARERMVICGLSLLQEIMHGLDLEIRCKDGDVLQSGAQIAIVRGSVRKILKLERVTLNFFQHLSGISTLTAEYVKETCNTKAKIFDTRKTTPGFRDLEKYAVKCGGGENHRMRLDDMVLIKDNHIVASGGITAAVKASRESNPDLKVELEVDDLQQYQEALLAEPDIIMLDNFSLQDLREAVSIMNIRAQKTLLEASGGVNLATVKEIAETGVDRISTSKITQSAPAVDIGLDEMTV